MAAQQTKQSGGSNRPKAKADSRQDRGVAPADVARNAASELNALTGRDIEAVTGLERDDDGWTVQIEVLEARRIPDSADILALYETKTDTSGEVREYRRVRRYGRGRTGDD